MSVRARPLPRDSGATATPSTPKLIDAFAGDVEAHRDLAERGVGADGAGVVGVGEYAEVVGADEVAVPGEGVVEGHAEREGGEAGDPAEGVVVALVVWDGAEGVGGHVVPPAESLDGQITGPGRRLGR